MRALVVFAVCGCSSTATTRAARDTPQPAERDADVVETATRAPRGAQERTLVKAGFVFDPALDCVARRSGNPPDPRRYHHQLPVRCGSPLYPVDARPVGTSIEAAALEMKQRFAPGVPLALGVGNGVVVVAARLVEIEPLHPGDATLRGKTLVNVVKSDVFVSREDGVTRSPVALENGSFAIPVPAGPADLEVAIVTTNEAGPLARFRIGHGSPLFGGGGPMAQRANAARARLGLQPLDLVAGVGLCDQIPARIGGKDVSDKALCYSAPHVTDVDVLANDLGWSPLIQARFLDPSSSFLEVGRVGTSVVVRVTKPFEVLSPAAGRKRILAQYRAWWPGLVERPMPPGALSAVFDTWRRAPDLSTEPPAAAKAQLDQIAGKWTNTTRYWSALGTSREFEKAIEITRPTERPLAIDAMMIQVRDSKGAMRNLVAVALVLPR